MNRHSMLDDIDQVRRSKPHYPSDPDLHKLYQAHIARWKPLIDSNDPSIYTDWEGLCPWVNNEDDERLRVYFMLDNSLVSQSNLTIHRDDGVLTKLTMPIGRLSEPTVRRDLMLIVLASYIDYIENRYCTKKWGHAELCIHKPGLQKQDIVELVDHLSRSGKNPFDLLYADLTGARPNDADVTTYYSQSKQEEISSIVKGADLDNLYIILHDRWEWPDEVALVKRDLARLHAKYRRNRHRQDETPLVEGLHPELENALRESKSMQDLHRKIIEGRKPHRRFLLLLFFAVLTSIVAVISERIGCAPAP